MKNRILAALLLLPFLVQAFTAPAAAAGYVNNRAQWLALNAEARAAYAQAMNDSLNYIFTDDALATALTKLGRTQCMIDNGITAAKLADKITEGYKDERYALFSPTAIYIVRITEECKLSINRSRLSFGLGPI